MDQDLSSRIKGFFDYWKKRYEFIDSLNFNEYSHEANVLIWASLDALSNVWAENIGKEECNKLGQRMIFEAFLARYGGELWQLVSLPDVWKRIDDGNVSINKEKLPNDVCRSLQTIGGRCFSPDLTDLEQRRNRSISDDWKMDKIINEILNNHPTTDRARLEEWLALSRYGAIAYKEMRSAYIHMGQPGKGTHGFELYGFEDKPTYLSWVYNTPPIMGFNIKFMLGVLECCIKEFEDDALKLQKDPVPAK